MRVEGLEPPRAEAHQVLSLARISSSATPAVRKRIDPVAAADMAAAAAHALGRTPNLRKSSGA
jgi:hypothetical protein